MPRKHESFTIDPTKNKFRRTVEALLNPINHTLSNREIAKQIRVDESMVRKYRDMLGVPKLEQGSGRDMNGERRPTPPKTTYRIKRKRK